MTIGTTTTTTTTTTTMMMMTLWLLLLTSPLVVVTKAEAATAQRNHDRPDIYNTHINDNNAKEQSFASSRVTDEGFWNGGDDHNNRLLSSEGSEEIMILPSADTYVDVSNLTANGQLEELIVAQNTYTVISFDVSGLNTPNLFDHLDDKTAILELSPISSSSATATAAASSLRIGRIPNLPLDLTIEELEPSMLPPGIDVNAILESLLIQVQVGPTFEVNPDTTSITVDVSDLIFGEGSLQQESDALLVIESLDGGDPSQVVATFHSRESDRSPKLHVIMTSSGESPPITEAPTPEPTAVPVESTPQPTPELTTSITQAPTPEPTPVAVESTPRPTPELTTTITEAPTPEPTTAAVEPTPQPTPEPTTPSPTIPLTCSGEVVEENCNNNPNGCFWCFGASVGVCRNSQAECPGQGRVKPCSGLMGDECTSSGCLWCGDAEICTSVRGSSSNKCPVVVALPPTSENNTNIDDGGNGTLPEAEESICVGFQNETDCTSNLECRWCDSDWSLDSTSSLCKSSDNFCEDGTLGIRGDPCALADADSETDCPSECLWCSLSSECQKPSDQACIVDPDPIEDGNASSTPPLLEYNDCQLIDVGPDCQSQEECQWCQDQSRCELLDGGTCGESRGEAAIVLGIPVNGEGAGAASATGGARFAIQDDGLGSTDPDEVFVSLEYLFEVNEDEQSITPSFIDFAFEEFTIQQSVGNFFPNSQDSIFARKITFQSTISDVGSIEMDTFVFLNGGQVITDSGEIWNINKGDIKFNIKMSDWSFYGEDGGSDTITRSEFIDVAVRIQGSKDVPDPSNESDLVYNLGGNIPLRLSNKVNVDSVVQDMPNGFPRAENTDEQGTVFVLRFPRFDTDVEYDPIIGFHETFLEPTSSPTTTPVLETEISSPNPIATTTPAPIVAPGSGTSPVCNVCGGNQEVTTPNGIIEVPALLVSSLGFSQASCSQLLDAAGDPANPLYAQINEYCLLIPPFVTTPCGCMDPTDTTNDANAPGPSPDESALGGIPSQTSGSGVDVGDEDDSSTLSIGLIIAIVVGGIVVALCVGWVGMSCLMNRTGRSNNRSHGDKGTFEDEESGDHGSWFGDEENQRNDNDDDDDGGDDDDVSGRESLDSVSLDDGDSDEEDSDGEDSYDS